MARRRGRYKMTPRRRAALKKAQTASARKRRGQKLKAFGKVAGQVAATVAIGAAMYHIEEHARHPSKFGTTAKSAKGLFSKSGKGRVDPNTPGVSLRPNAMRSSRPYYGIPGTIRRPIRGGVAGRKITSRQRASQGRLF